MRIEMFNTATHNVPMMAWLEKIGPGNARAVRSTNDARIKETPVPGVPIPKMEDAFQQCIYFSGTTVSEAKASHCQQRLLGLWFAFGGPETVCYLKGEMPWLTVVKSSLSATAPRVFKFNMRIHTTPKK